MRQLDHLWVILLPMLGLTDPHMGQTILIILIFPKGCSKFVSLYRDFVYFQQGPVGFRGSDRVGITQIEQLQGKHK